MELGAGLRVIPLVSMLALGCDHQELPPQTPNPHVPLACKSDLEPEQLVPADAVIVGYYDMARERRMAPDVSGTDAAGPRSLLPSAEMEAVRLGWVALAAACELHDDFWGSAWVAMNREDEVTVVLTGTGIGNRDNLRCIQGRLARWTDGLNDPNLVSDDGCGVSVSVEGLHGFAPHDDLLVLGTHGAVDRARTAWTYEQRPLPSPLVPKRRRDRHVWVAVDVAALVSPDELESALSRSCPEPLEDDVAPFANIRTMELEGRLSRRYALRVGASFGAEADARAAEAVLQAVIDAPPAGTPDWGRELIDALKLDRDDMHVTLELPLSRREAHELGIVPSRTEAQQVPGLPWMLLSLALAR